MNASQTPLEENMHQIYSRALTWRQRPHRQQQSQQLPIQADHQAETFAGVAPGLKSAAHGGTMPFTQNLTPIDGLGPFGESRLAVVALLHRLTYVQKIQTTPFGPTFMILFNLDEFGAIWAISTMAMNRLRDRRKRCRHAIRHTNGKPSRQPIEDRAIL
jgi:hypothetical protein